MPTTSNKPFRQDIEETFQEQTKAYDMKRNLSSQSSNSNFSLFNSDRNDGSINFNLRRPVIAKSKRIPQIFTLPVNKMSPSD